MEMHEFQERAAGFVEYPPEKGLEYVTLGLVGEAGEFANKIKKLVRGDNPPPSSMELSRELGDVLWYLARCASELGYTLETVAWDNIEKLTERQERGKLKGTGDNR